MVRLDRRLLSRAKPSLLRLLAGAALAVSGSFPSPVARADEGAPRLNAVARFFGFGYSQHGYHSGRAATGHQNHPAYYPSGQLTQIYLPAHYAMPQTRTVGMGQFQSQVTMQVQQPKRAPEVPVGPPPKWLEPYLKGQSEDQLPPPVNDRAGESSPSDRNRSNSPSSLNEEIDLLGVGESPYDNELIPANPNSLPGLTPRNLVPNQGTLPEGVDSANGDSLLNGDLLDESLLDDNPPPSPGRDAGSSSDDDLLGADARYRYRSSTPTVQSTMHLYTPFR